MAEPPYSANISATAGQATSERSATLQYNTATSGGTTRPRKRSRIRERNPMRLVTWYTVNNTDIRNIGVAQAATVAAFSIGTWALDKYLDLQKDIAQANASHQQLSNYVLNLEEAFRVLWIILWVVGVISLVWQSSEWRRIRTEHGEMTWRERIKKLWTKNVTR
jgi:hypothetical protein